MLLLIPGAIVLACLCGIALFVATNLLGVDVVGIADEDGAPTHGRRGGSGSVTPVRFELEGFTNTHRYHRRGHHVPKRGEAIGLSVWRFLGHDHVAEGDDAEVIFIFSMIGGIAAIPLSIGIRELRRAKRRRTG